MMLDIGANIGNHSIYFANQKIFSSIVSFEPIKSTYDILQKNIDINGYRSFIRCINKGVGSHQSKAVVESFKKSNIGGTRLNYGNGEIEIVTIDSYDFNNVTFAKIDVEGFEVEVIKGFKSTIEKCKPILLIEIQHDVIDISKVIFDYLESLGYFYIRLDIDNYLFYQ